jgi:hypothetical protein
VWPGASNVSRLASTTVELLNKLTYMILIVLRTLPLAKASGLKTSRDLISLVCNSLCHSYFL